MSACRAKGWYQVRSLTHLFSFLLPRKRPTDKKKSILSCGVLSKVHTMLVWLNVLTLHNLRWLKYLHSIYIARFSGKMPGQHTGRDIYKAYMCISTLPDFRSPFQSAPRQHRSYTASCALKANSSANLKKNFIN